MWSSHTHLSTAKKFLFSFFFFQLVYKWREAQIGVKMLKLIFPSLINPLRSFVYLSCHANLDTIRVSSPSRGQKRYVWLQVLHYGLIIFKKKKNHRSSVSFTIRSVQSSSSSTIVFPSWSMRILDKLSRASIASSGNKGVERIWLLTTSRVYIIILNMHSSNQALLKLYYYW